MVHTDLAIIVEGKYDKMRVERVCDGLVFTTDGFRIFKDKEKRNFIKLLCEKRGILILTDSDRAGFMIRNHIKGIVGNGNIKHAYIPEISGKERRKRTPSKEGKLGVEGIDDALIEEILRKFSSESSRQDKITKMDLYSAGLYGGAGSAASRALICERLMLPKRMSPGAFMDAINAIMTKDEFFEMMVDNNA